MSSPIPIAIVILWCLLLAMPATAEPAQTDEETVEEPKKHRWYVMPLAFWDADNGLGFGGRFQIQRLDPDREPYRSSFAIHLSASLRGWHHHRLNFDLPGRGKRGKMRLYGWFAYRQWLHDGYWGIGNGTARERAFVGSFDSDDPAGDRYDYTLIQPFGSLTLRHELAGQLAGFGNLTFQYTYVKTHQQSLLREHWPQGVDGGVSVQLSLGLMVDTRSPEAITQRGVLLEASARISPRLPDSTGPYYGPFLSLRAFTPLGSPRVVLAARIMADWLFGDVPFYEMTRWGGFEPILGFGGRYTLRGVNAGRWRAPGKAVANVELRLDLFSHKFLKTRLGWQIVPFGDVGVVWGAHELATDPEPAFPLHPAAGLGIRAIMSETFAVRLDVGFAPDAIREPDGTLTQQPNVGLYVTYDQMF